MNDNVLGTDAVESPSAVEANDESLGMNLFEEVFGESIDGSAPSEEPVASEDSQAEEDSAEPEEIADDDSDDTPVEAEEVDEEGESDPEVNESAEIEVLNYDELFEQVGALEINGKAYTPAQLKSILGQEESAGTKSREASERLKEVEAKQEALAQQEEQLKQRFEAAGQVDNLVQIQHAAQQVHAALEQARADGDAYEITIRSDQLRQLEAQYHESKQVVDAERARQEQAQFQQAKDGLLERGLGYLLEDTPQARAWFEYASSNLTPQELQIARKVPAVAEAIEKARKWDISKGKVKDNSRKLKSSHTSLKSGTGNKLKSNQSKQESARKQRLRSGDASEGDIHKSALNVAKDILGL